MNLLRSLRLGRGKAGTGFQALQQLRQVRILALPIQLRKAESQPAQGTTHGNIGQADMDAGAGKIVLLAGAGMPLRKSLKTAAEWYGDYVCRFVNDTLHQKQ